MKSTLRFDSRATVMFIAALALAAQGCESDEPAGDDDGTEKTPVFEPGDGYPELTASPVIASPSAQAGTEIDVTIPYDDDTGYVRLAIEDYATSDVLIQNWAEEVPPGGGEVSATVTIPSTTTPVDTYYFTFDLCSSDACTDPYKRTTYERVDGGSTYTRVGFTSPPLTQDDGPRDSKISIPTFDIE